MFTVMVELHAHAERIEEFLVGIRANAHASLRDEPGCIRFDVQRSIEDPTRFHLYEIYVDRDAFEVAHRSAPHYADWQEVVRRCVVPGTRHNTYASPVFPQDIPEAVLSA
jgi:autoinducer 2-degrading protein